MRTDLTRSGVTHTFQPFSFFFAIVFVIITLKEDPRDSLLGLIFIALGIPGYLFWKRRQRANNTPAES